jgi:hypothetical protein
MIKMWRNLPNYDDEWELVDLGERIHYNSPRSPSYLLHMGNKWKKHVNTLRDIIKVNKILGSVENLDLSRLSRQQLLLLVIILCEHYYAWTPFKTVGAMTIVQGSGLLNPI